ncbi:aspartate--tRNA(Asn) ligase [Spirochaetia bacterium]|nr:aspartate--tRNA(Asn) ligase [Spirochaetia bacterium]
MRLLAKDMLGAAQQKPQDEVEAAGWVHRIRDMGGIRFVILRDRSGLLQLVLSEAEASMGVDLTLESVIIVRGIPALNDKAPGGVELRLRSLKCVSKAAGDLPFQVNGDVSKIGIESILDNRSLSLRNPKIRSIFRIQSTILEAFAAFLRQQDFTEIKTSKLVGSGTEGGANLFEVKYFERKVYLAQSPQFYKQTMVAAGLERVFEIGAVYRAEKYDTPRHLSEYVSLDVEMGFIESEKELIELEKNLLAYIFAQVIEKNAADIALWNTVIPDPASVAKAPTVSYEEALKIVNAEAACTKGKNDGRNASGVSARIFDITPEAERLLCEWSLREHGSDLAFINEFPRQNRPFYTYPLNTSNGGAAATTMSFDAIFRGLEITSGSRRQHDYNALVEALPKFGLKPEDMAGYLAVFKSGCPPHGGFAIGCERLTQKLLGLPNVKEASLFPRDRKRVEP